MISSGARHATVGGVLRRRRRPKLHRCPQCGSDSVSRWHADDLGDAFRGRVRLNCAECGTTRELVATVWAIDAYSRRHEQQRMEIAVALRSLERERMAADVDLLVEALRHDLIGPDDFTLVAGRRARRPALRSP
jgi:transcription elongation factor Elf1